MSLGDYPLGEETVGEPYPIPEAEARARGFVGRNFDGMTRDFPRDDAGFFEAIHPVDSAMQMALMVALGKVASSTTTGNSLRGVKYIDPRRTSAEVKDRVARATAALVNRGDVTIERVFHESPNQNALFVQVDYFNERLPDRPRKSVQART